MGWTCPPFVAIGALVASIWAASLPGRRDPSSDATTSEGRGHDDGVQVRAQAEGTVRKGTVVLFTVTNRGTVAHDFKIAGKKTAKVCARQANHDTLRVTFQEA